MKTLLLSGILAAVAVRLGHTLGWQHGYRRALHDFTAW